MKQMMNVFESYGGPVVAVQQVPRAEISAYGVIDGAPEGDTGRLYRVRDMVEKPKAEEAPSDLAIIGRYLLTPDIFDEIERTERGKGGEIQLTDGLRRLADKRPLYGYQFTGVAARRGQQARLPEGHGGVRAQARGPGRPVPRVPEVAHAIGGHGGRSAPRMPVHQSVGRPFVRPQIRRRVSTRRLASPGRTIRQAHSRRRGTCGGARAVRDDELEPHRAGDGRVVERGTNGARRPVRDLLAAGLRLHPPPRALARRRRGPDPVLLRALLREGLPPRLPPGSRPLPDLPARLDLALPVQRVGPRAGPEARRGQGPGLVRRRDRRGAPAPRAGRPAHAGGDLRADLGRGAARPLPGAPARGAEGHGRGRALPAAQGDSSRATARAPTTRRSRASSA